MKLCTFLYAAFFIELAFDIYSKFIYLSLYMYRIHICELFVVFVYKYRLNGK